MLTAVETNARSLGHYSCVQVQSTRGCKQGGSLEVKQYTSKCCGAQGGPCGPADAVVMRLDTKAKMNVRNVVCGSLESVDCAPKVGVQWTVMLLCPSIARIAKNCVTGH